MNAVRRATVGLVVLAAGTAGAQDLLVLRDGSRRTGALQSCVADRCHLDGRPVERADIAWIGLAAAGDAPPPAVDPQLDEVHLVDGSIELGRVVGISLGAVALESASFERDRVAWIRFRGEDAGSDVLVLRSGERRLGELAACAGDSCSFDGTSWPRSSIVWIGLRRSDAAPPAASDPASDEIHLVDESVEPGPLVGIGADSVVGQRGSHPRDEVAWVYLAPHRPDRSGLPDQVGAPPPDAPAADPAAGGTGRQDTGSGDAPSPQPPAGPRPENRTRVRPCPSNQPLGGTVRLEWAFQPAEQCEALVTTTLWFPLVSGDRLIPIPENPWYLQLVGYHAPRVHYEIAWDQCQDLPSLVDEVCTAPAGRAAGILKLSEKRVDDGFYLSFKPLDPSLAFMFTRSRTRDEMLKGQHLEITCMRPGNPPSTGDYGLAGFELQIRACSSECRGGEHDGIQAFFVPPTVCYEDYGGCGRLDDHAVIPFAGQDTWSEPYGFGAEVVRSTVDWEVCCGCGRPPSGPPPEGVDPVTELVPLGSSLVLPRPGGFSESACTATARSTSLSPLFFQLPRDENHCSGRRIHNPSAHTMSRSNSLSGNVPSV